MSDDDRADVIAFKDRLAGLRAQLREAAATAADMDAIKDRLAGELRARRTAQDAALRQMLGEPQPKRRKRKPTLTGVAKQAAKAGVEVAGYEVRPDGTIGSRCRQAE